MNEGRQFSYIAFGLLTSALALIGLIGGLLIN